MGSLFTMIKNSVWWPADAKRAALLASVPLLIILRQSELFGLYDSTVLVFGWLPIQLAYDAALLLLAVVIGYAFYTQVPEPRIEEVEEPTVDPETIVQGGED